jgi:16S rRNA (uracil1498-N3)-methyltransferase
MPRFFIEPPPPHERRLTLVGPDVHHIRTVLRLVPGDAVMLASSTGREYRAVIRKTTTRAVEVEIVEELPLRPSRRLEVSLAQALPRSAKMELIVQKATELGVSSIHPFTSSRTVPRPDEGRRRRRRERWHRIAVEAGKQCRRLLLPQVHDIVPFEEVLRAPAPAARKIVLWEEAPAAWDSVFSGADHTTPFFVLVGPEGGLSAEEVEECRRAGFIPAGLGPRILRTETASLCILAILQYQLGDMR